MADQQWRPTLWVYPLLGPLGVASIYGSRSAVHGHGAGFWLGVSAFAAAVAVFGVMQGVDVRSPIVRHRPTGWSWLPAVAGVAYFLLIGRNVDPDIGLMVVGAAMVALASGFVCGVGVYFVRRQSD